MKYKEGDHVIMTDVALENYGENYRGQVFTVESCANCVEDHPGYDDSIAPQGLYDLEGLNYSLYDYELDPA